MCEHNCNEDGWDAGLCPACLDAYNQRHNNRPALQVMQQNIYGFDEAVEAGARNAYAKCHNTNGPYTIKEYASADVMQKQHEIAKYVIEGYLAELAKRN